MLAAGEFCVVWATQCKPSYIRSGHTSHTSNFSPWESAAHESSLIYSPPKLCHISYMEGQKQRIAKWVCFSKGGIFLSLIFRCHLSFKGTICSVWGPDPTARDDQFWKPWRKSRTRGVGLGWAYRDSFSSQGSQKSSLVKPGNLSNDPIGDWTWKNMSSRSCLRCLNKVPNPQTFGCTWCPCHPCPI